MLKEQWPVALVAALRWEGVTEEQIDLALAHIKSLRPGQSITDRGTFGESEHVRNYATQAGDRLYKMTNS